MAGPIREGEPYFNAVYCAMMVAREIAAQREGTAAVLAAMQVGLRLAIQRPDLAEALLASIRDWQSEPAGANHLLDRDTVAILQALPLEETDDALRPGPARDVQPGTRPVPEGH